MRLRRRGSISANEWPPKITEYELFEIQHFVDLDYETWRTEGYNDNNMKAFEENRYGQD